MKGIKSSLRNTVLVISLILAICLLMGITAFVIYGKNSSLPVAKIERIADNKLKLICNDIAGVTGYIFSKNSLPNENSKIVSFDRNKKWSIEQEFDGNGVYYLQCVNAANKLSNIASYGEWIVPSSYEFVVAKSGYYKLEIWGAQGGNTSVSQGGKGGYSVGYKKLNAGDTLYLTIGSKGSDAVAVNINSDVQSGLASSGSNGGGIGISNSEMMLAAGGGASHVATIPGVLFTLFDNKDSVLIVAGGGGGASADNEKNGFNGGAGGGISGLDGETKTNSGGKGGTQVSGGTGYAGEYTCIDCDISKANKDTSGGFGYGANVCGNNQYFENYPNSFYECYSAAGAGSGYYGGGSGYALGGAGGGSSYIGGVENGSTEAGVREGHGKIVITWYGTKLK